MNCLEFRRLLLQDPYADDPAMREHEQSCDQCRHYAEEQRLQEEQLRDMLNDISPPPELAEKILLAAHLKQRGRFRRQAWYAAAASVLLIVGATITSLITESWERGNMALAQSVLNHIEDEAHHLREAGPVAQNRARFVFARFGAQLVEDIGQINFAAECLMRKRNGVHLVLSGEQGPITAFFMPGEHVEETIPVKSERFQGTITPTGWGSVAVVGEHGENLQDMTARLSTAVSWPIRGDSINAGSGRAAAPLIAQK